MPTYVFRCPKCGWTTEVVCSFRAVPGVKRCQGCGKRAYRDLKAEHAAPAALPSGWPMHSEALGVLPEQIPEAVAELHAAGIRNVEFRADGALKLDSPSDRKRKAEALGFYDRNGGYGDPRRR